MCILYIYICIYICVVCFVLCYCMLMRGQLLCRDLALRSISEISSCFFGPRPWHIEIRHRVKKTSTINLFGFETLKLKIRRLKLWKPTVLDPGPRSRSCIDGHLTSRAFTKDFFTKRKRTKKKKRNIKTNRKTKRKRKNENRKKKGKNVECPAPPPWEPFPLSLTNVRPPARGR